MTYKWMHEGLIVLLKSTSAWTESYQRLVQENMMMKTTIDLWSITLRSGEMKGLLQQALNPNRLSTLKNAAKTMTVTCKAKNIYLPSKCADTGLKEKLPLSETATTQSTRVYMGSELLYSVQDFGF